MRFLLRSDIFKSDLRKVLAIALAWFIIANLNVLYEYLVIKHYDYTPPGYNLWLFLGANIIMILVGGLIGGSLLVGVMNRWLRSLPYGVALFYIFLTYLLVSTLVVIITASFINAYRMELPFYHREVRTVVWNYFGSLDYLRNLVFWLFVVLATLIILLINDKYGPGVFRSFLLGKYFHPVREKRIFMFLDLRSSTSIAEQLGDRDYFDFLQEVFREVTPAILYCQGDIYQYVGDEIVISWTIENGVDKGNCVRCFFAIQNRLRQAAGHYRKKYGVVPEFKAGLHFGPVIAGELGVVKRDIVYSGDVLNTTARIQSLCNEKQVDLLISKDLLHELPLPPHHFSSHKIGDIFLRGKQEKIVLYTVEAKAW